METYQILLTDRDPQGLYQERRNSQLGSQGPTHNEKVQILERIISHDIRGSLVSMVATLKLLSRGYYGKMDESVANRLNELISKAIGLIGITEEYLDRTFSVSDGLDVEGEVVDIAKDIISPVLEELSGEINDHQILLDNRMEILSANKIVLKGGKVWLKSVFRNLLKKAIRYGDKGGRIVLDCENDGSYCRLNVFNSGKPIPEEWHDKLFTGFVRVGNNNNGGTPGMGLGLYLVKKIMQEHGGEIGYEAREDGSNFVFTLPVGDSQFGGQSV
jgi:signal transduction histidine kinase